MAKLFADLMQQAPAAGPPPADLPSSAPQPEELATTPLVQTPAPAQPLPPVEAPDWTEAPIVSLREEPRQLNANVRRRHLRILDRYYQKLYNTRTRVTKGQLVMLAIEMLDLVLGGDTPANFDTAALLERYLNRKTEREAAT